MDQVVWVPEPKEGFILATIVDLGMDEVTVQPVGSSKTQFTLPLDRVYTANPHFDDKDVDDNCKHIILHYKLKTCKLNYSFTGSLMHLNEATLLNNVKKRYSKDKIYVSTYLIYNSKFSFLVSKIFRI